MIDHFNEICLTNVFENAMDVLINGERYAPVSLKTENIGIAISTHNRHDVLSRALEYQLKFLPAGALVVVIDDGSSKSVKVPEGVRVIRHDVSHGIVAAKNASLQALIDAGCEHLFLWDDDAWPIAGDWERPYIESPEPHLAYQFQDFATGQKLNDIAVLYRDDRHIAYTGQRGVMLYYHRSAIEKVGGFDRIYERGMYEHSDLALRIHNAGLTSWAFADVVGSEKLIYSLDEHQAVERSVPKPDREAQVKRNVTIHNERRNNGYTDYAEYRQQRNVVITTLLTSQPDPQRGTKMTASPDLLAKWAASVKGGDAVVLADELNTAPAGASLVAVPDVKMNVYFRRAGCISGSTFAITLNITSSGALMVLTLRCFNSRGRKWKRVGFTRVLSPRPTPIPGLSNRIRSHSIRPSLMSIGII